MITLPISKYNYYILVNAFKPLKIILAIKSLQGLIVNIILNYKKICKLTNKMELYVPSVQGKTTQLNIKC